jgi:AraC-like DNA-binding protein
MKPHAIKVIVNPEHSFSVRQDVVPYFFSQWHHHPEVELVHIEKGTGIQFIGDHVARFKAGDVMMVGADLPHVWRCDEAYMQGRNDMNAAATVIHFREQFWGPSFLELPENKAVKDMLELSKRGLLITGITAKSIQSQMQEMLSAEGANRIIILMKMLQTIASSTERKPLASASFSASANHRDSERMGRIYDYTLAHFRKKITLREIAQIAVMSEHSFCRYFKSHTHKTYIHFLLELRIGYACKLLIQNRNTISQICFDSGFNNMTNFYKAFKKIKGQTPFVYQRAFLMAESS